MTKVHHQVSQSNWLNGKGLGKGLSKTLDKRLAKANLQYIIELARVLAQKQKYIIRLVRVTGSIVEVLVKDYSRP